MNITSLIPSKSVAEYLEKQSYEFSVLQCAYIIAKSNKLCVREKHAEWKKLSETMKDCEIFNGLLQEHHESLFAVLEQISTLQTQYIEKFFQEEEAIFHLESVKRNGENLYVGGNCTHTLHESTHSAELDSRLGTIFTVNKQLFNSAVSITATINELDEVLDLQVMGAPINEDRILSFFDGIHLTFPVPFQTGDVIFEIENPQMPMVIKGLTNCGMQQICCATSCFDGTLTENWVDDLLSLDYYRKRLTENEIRLKNLSELLRESLAILK